MSKGSDRPIRRWLAPVRVERFATYSPCTGSSPYVFGPAVENGSRALEDVRYAVRGLPPRVYFDMLAEIWDVTGSFPVVQNLEGDDPFVRFLEDSHELRPVDALFG